MVSKIVEYIRYVNSQQSTNRNQENMHSKVKMTPQKTKTHKHASYGCEQRVKRPKELCSERPKKNRAETREQWVCWKMPGSNTTQNDSVNESNRGHTLRSFIKTEVTCGFFCIKT